MAAENETIALHIGYLRDADKTDLISALEDLESVTAVFDEGDTWEEWGEAETEGNHGHLVVQVSGDNPIALQNLAKELGQKYGKVISDDHYRCTWAVTTMKDWSDTYSSSGPVKKAA